uniref:HTH CENPB-type domain-containing protein n=1 Tax=Angiostrongylus cantonensis TaxID=6313 RepID=A0A158P7K9_ANGCA
MNPFGSTSDANTSGELKDRKRRTSEETVDAIQSLAKALRLEAEADASTSSDELRITSCALQLFARKSAANHFNSTEITASKNSATVDPTISSDHPMKQIVDQSDKEMSVKEALAKGFRNYKVRLPKRKLQYDPDPAIDTSVLYSLFANDAVDENHKDAELAYPHPTVKSNHGLKSNSDNVMEQEKGEKQKEQKESSELQLDLDALIKSEPADSPATAETRQNPSVSVVDEIDRRASVYVLPPFWSLPLVVSKGYRGGYYIRGVKYVQMTTLMQDGTLAVSLYVPIRFEYDGQIVKLTLSDILLANGIAINDPSNCVELIKVFTTSVLLLHHVIAEHLLCSCGPNPLNPSATIKCDYEAIPITAELPPLACHKSEYFELLVFLYFRALNASYGPNELFHPYRIESIILNRAEVIRDHTAALMAETDADEDPERNFSGTRKKNKVRRTSFVGLNILMWRFFKDCRDNGIVLNGKLLKEHAMMIARQLGLENFKGSEGWLDAFKRRHRIDLKVMSGVPVHYEETDEDRMEDILDEGDFIPSKRAEPLSDGEFSISEAHSSGGGITAALLECVEKATSKSPAPVAVASVSNTGPLNLANLLGGGDGSITDNLSDVHGLADGTSSVHVSPTGLLPHCQVAPSLPSDEKGFIAAVVKSAAIRVHDKELSSSLETIRSYILSNDASIMPLFLELQLKLAAVSCL